MPRTQEEMRTHNKRYYAKNKEKITTQAKVWRERNKEKLIADKKVWYAKNKQRIAAEKKDWSNEQKEEKRVYNKLYQVENKNKIASRKKVRYEETLDPNATRVGTEEYRIQMSCALQGIAREDFKGYTDKSRPYIDPIHSCIKLNDYFVGSDAHHITKSIVVYIPSELHNHISHNIKNGTNMGEINLLAFQFINGEL